MLVLLVLLIGAVTSVWADDNVDLSTGGTNGEFSFFSAAECNPTAENIARWCCDQITNCYRVDVQETTGNIATYEKDE